MRMQQMRSDSGLPAPGREGVKESIHHKPYTERAGAQSAKCLPCKYKCMSSIPRTHAKEDNHKLLIPVLGNQRKADCLRLND